jgi:hypothetical protein
VHLSSARRLRLDKRKVRSDPERADPRLSKRYTSSDQKRPDVDRSEGYRSIQTWKGASIRVSGAPYLTRIDLKKADCQIPTS